MTPWKVVLIVLGVLFALKVVIPGLADGPGDFENMRSHPPAVHIGGEPL